MHSRVSGATLELAKGQLWKTREGYLEIVDVKRLVHYRILKHPRQRLVRTQMSNMADLQDYLKSHEAELVEGEGEKDSGAATINVTGPGAPIHGATDSAN